MSSRIIQESVRPLDLLIDMGGLFYKYWGHPTKTQLVVLSSHRTESCASSLPKKPYLQKVERHCLRLHSPTLGRSRCQQPTARCFLFRQKNMVLSCHMMPATCESARPARARLAPSQLLQASDARLTSPVRGLQCLNQRNIKSVVESA